MLALMFRIIILSFLAYISTGYTHANDINSPAFKLNSSNIFDYPSNYVAVQLFASKSKSKVIGFINKNNLGDPPFGKIKSKGQLWYVLLLGIYPDKSSAKTAIAQLPKRLKIKKPWIRKLGPLKKSSLAVFQHDDKRQN